MNLSPDISGIVSPPVESGATIVAQVASSCKCPIELSRNTPLDRPPGYSCSGEPAADHHPGEGGEEAEAGVGGDVGQGGQGVAALQEGDGVVAEGGEGGVDAEKAG